MYRYNPVLGEFFRCRYDYPDGSRGFYIAEQGALRPSFNVPYPQRCARPLVSCFIGRSELRLRAETLCDRFTRQLLSPTRLISPSGIPMYGSPVSFKALTFIFIAIAFRQKRKETDMECLTPCT